MWFRIWTSGIRELGCESRISHLEVVWSWASHSSFLESQIYICFIIALTSKDSFVKHFMSFLVYNNCSIHAQHYHWQFKNTMIIPTLSTSWDFYEEQMRELFKRCFISHEKLDKHNYVVRVLKRSLHIAPLNKYLLKKQCISEWNQTPIFCFLPWASESKSDNQHSYSQLKFLMQAQASQWLSTSTSPIFLRNSSLRRKGF